MLDTRVVWVALGAAKAFRFMEGYRVVRSQEKKTKSSRTSLNFKKHKKDI